MYIQLVIKPPKLDKKTRRENQGLDQWKISLTQLGNKKKNRLFVVSEDEKSLKPS